MNKIPDKHTELFKRTRVALNRARLKIEDLKQAKSEPIAIVGMGCRFPGGSDNPDKFWKMLLNGNDAIVDIPSDRWDVNSFYDSDNTVPGKICFKQGGFLNEIDKFDAKFFGFSRREAESMDPQHRILLEVCWEAFENAGIAPDSLKNSKTGVYIGIGQNDYSRLEMNCGDPKRINAYSGTGNLFCFAPGRLSYVLGLQGPNIAVDTACSSSLASLHLACMGLRNNEADLAIAGGVHLIISPEISVFLSMTGAVSPDCRSKTFDASANGFARGEGCGVVVLKRLSDAVANRDSILALVRGSSINHDGPSSGFTVPNEQSQEKVIRQAITNANVDPNMINYIEAHGTGTSLGDPIEVGAIASALCSERSSDNPLLIGSVKTNVGHLEAAAGIVGLIKVVLSMIHRQIPPHLHFQTPNPHIDWNNIPVSVPTNVTAWPDSENMFAGISSFSMSGVNAHVIVEGVNENSSSVNNVYANRNAENQFCLFTISARNDESLKLLAVRYIEYLDSVIDITLDNICYTANSGRADFRYRLSATVLTIPELSNKLKAFINGQTPDYLISGQEVQQIGTVEKFDDIYSKTELDKLGKAYVNGKSIEWQLFYQDSNASSVPLPSYPFQRRSYWVEKPESVEGDNYPLCGKPLHLPFSNETRFELDVTRNSPSFMNDHKVFDHVVGAAAYHISLILTGIDQAFGIKSCFLENLLFLQAMIIPEKDNLKVQLLFSQLDDGKISFKLISANSSKAQDNMAFSNNELWTTHCSGQVLPFTIEHPADVNESNNIEKLKSRCKIELTASEFYSNQTDVALQFGPMFQWGEKYWYGCEGILCQLKSVKAPEEKGIYRLHPGLLDTCFQLLNNFLINGAKKPENSNDILLPFSISSFKFYGVTEKHGQLWCRAYFTDQTGSRDGSSYNQLRLSDENGGIIAEVSRFEYRIANREALLKKTQSDLMVKDDKPIIKINSLKNNSNSNIIEQLEVAAPARRRSILTSFVSTCVAVVLKIEEDDEIEPDMRLFDEGMDSIMAVVLINDIGAAFDREFCPTLLFNYPTIDAIVGYLMEELKIDDNIVDKSTLDSTDSLSDDILMESDDLGSFLSGIESMPESEVKNILAKDNVKSKKEIDKTDE